MNQSIHSIIKLDLKKERFTSNIKRVKTAKFILQNIHVKPNAATSSEKCNLADSKPTK